MTTATGSHDVRSQRAEKVLATFPHGGKDLIVLRVQCSRNHHVAVVYDTPDGLVYAAPVRARSHGDHDLPDDPHKGSTPTRWLDFLRVADPAAEDALPAWCDCGQRSLSRVAVLAWIRDRERRVIVD